jgi:hypothetical protein
MNNTVRAWLFRVLVLVAGGLLVFTWFHPGGVPMLKR